MIDEKLLLIRLDGVMEARGIIKHRRGSIEEARQDGELNAIEIIRDLIASLTSDSEINDH